MKLYSCSFLRCLFIGALITGTPKIVLAEAALDDHDHEKVVMSPDSRNQIIKLTDRGLVPASLQMKKDDSIVFFVNDTNDSLATLEIDFGSKPMHCGGGNMRAMEDGKTKSVRPFGPSDFATTCFHEPGDYKFTVFGLKTNPKGIQSTIHVE